MAHAHQHHGAERVFKGKSSAGQRGHEHHADDRRAARAPRHLHGRPAAVAARARRQPAGRNADSRSRRRPTSARSCWSTPPTRRSRSTSRTSPLARARRDASAPSSRSARTRRCSSAATARCATATSSRSSTPPRAPVSRRSASSPKACAASGGSESPPLGLFKAVPHGTAFFCLLHGLSAGAQRATARIAVVRRRCRRPALAASAL